MGENRNDELMRLIAVSLLVIAIVALGFAFWYARSVLIPFVIAAFVALLVAPFLDFQVIRLKVPKAIAVTTTLVLVLVILAVLFLFVSRAVQMVIATAGRYSDSFVAMFDNAIARAQDWGLDITQERLVGAMQKRIPQVASETFSTVIGFLSNLFFVAIFVVFLLMGRQSQTPHSNIYSNIDRQIRRYVTIKTGVSLVTGVLVWAVLSAFGLELAGLFGMLAFFLNFIPSIGSIIATLLPVPIAVAQFQNPWMVVAVVAVPGVFQTVIGNFVEPKLMGGGLDLHPVTVLLALSFWWLLWGVIGTLLAVPIMAVIRIVCMQFETLRPAGRLLAGELPKL